MQEVMAAITTAPSPSSTLARPATATGAEPTSSLRLASLSAPSAPIRWKSASVSPLSGGVPKASQKDCQTRGSGCRSCGRRGPASEGSTVSRSSSRVSLKVGVGDWSLRKSPCSLQ